MKFRLIGGIVAVVALGAFALPASAHTARFPSGVTIHHTESTPTYHGRVFSDLTKCQRGRSVQLRRADNDDVIGTVLTNREGRWRFDFSGKEYYAKVKRKVIEVGVHRHVCLPDTSRTV